MMNKDSITNQEYLESIEQSIKKEPYLDYENLLDFSQAVLQVLAMGKKPTATEMITQEIKKKQHIYTIRHDEKPESWIYFNGIYIPQGRTFIREYCRQILGEAYTPNFSSQVIAKVEADTYIDSDEFFKIINIDEVCLGNGIINIHTKKLRKHNPKDIFFNKIPVVYDPKKKCPKIIQHLETVLKNKDDTKIIQELFGYLLFKNYKIAKGFMFLGEGRNGKGKTLELMKRFLGVDNCCNISLQQLDDDMWALGDLFGKMANISGDLSSTALKETGSFKSVTGGDMLSASRKFLSRINFTNYAKMIFCANELPTTYDLTTAFFSRWILVEFPFTFVSKKEFDLVPKNEKENYKLADTEIVDKLITKDEMSGLLNWALEGLKRLLKDKDFSYSQSIEDVKTIWLRKSNSFNAFCLDYLEEDWEGKIEKIDLKKVYSIYCRKNKLGMVGDKSIKNVLERMFGVGENRVMRGDKLIYCWEGIKFNDCYGSYDCYGFSTIGKNGKIAIGVKKVATLGTLATVSEEKIE